jgi:putative ABC transport system permease protein
MMPPARLVRMVLANTVRSPRHFVLSAFGIVIGVAAFVFFLGLSMGVRGVVLKKVFPLEQVRVVAPQVIVATVDVSKQIDDSVVSAILAHPNVRDAVPRMSMRFPAAGHGTFEGSPLAFDVGPVADGIDGRFLADDPKLAAVFKDWTAEPGPACVPRPRKVEGVVTGVLSGSSSGSAAGSGAGSGSAAGSGAGSGSAAGSGLGSGGPGSGSGAGAGSGSGSGSGAGSAITPRKAPAWRNTCPSPERYYCDEQVRRCLHRVPVVISPFLLEMYSSTFAKTYKLPAVSADNAQGFIELRGMSKMSFNIILGASALVGQEEKELPPEQQRTVEAVLVGVSSKAIRIGLTLPIQYIERWNRELADARAASTYSAIEVTLRDSDQLATFVQYIKEKHGLSIDDPLGEKFATAIFVIAVLFTLISIAIITISAINIAHNFFMQVSERRREIGVLRAVGATQGDVRAIILGEAAVIGLIGGVLGVAGAFTAGAVVDWLSAHYLPRFPFKPDTYFDFQPWIWGMGVGFSILFCVVGGFLPARKAARMEPATALAQT